MSESAAVDSTEATARDRIRACMQAHQITVTSTFVPWSHSRSVVEAPKLTDYNLNWRVTLLKDGRLVTSCDYSAGQGHCRNYNQRDATRPSVDYAARIKHECETGRARMYAGEKAKPDPESVIASLCLDADVLNYSTFEQWAGEFGYDPDSRKGEQVYRACLETALALRAGLGDAVLQELQEACRDF